MDVLTDAAAIDAMMVAVGSAKSLAIGWRST